MKLMDKRAVIPVVLIVVVATALFAAGVSAHGGFGGGGFDRDDFQVDRLAVKLELTDAQIQQSESIAVRRRQQIRPLIREMMGVKKEIRGLISGDVFDESALREALAPKQALMTDLILNRVAWYFEVKSVLTPEQRKRFYELRRRL